MYIRKHVLQIDPQIYRRECPQTNFTIDIHTNMTTQKPTFVTTSKHDPQADPYI